jgi:hypothetical protein
MADLESPSSSGKTSPKLETRESRIGVDSARAETTERYGQAYLIEREAIELRRLRWKEHRMRQRKLRRLAAERAAARSPLEAAPPEPMPSAPRNLERYARPRAGPSQSDADKVSSPEREPGCVEPFWGTK